MFRFDILNNNLYVIFYCENLDKRNLCIIFASVNKNK